jgi:hypothetical protein
MRLSVEQDDPGFVAWQMLADGGANKDLKVFLDGVPVVHCLTADTETGYIKRHRLHEDGRVVVDNGEVCIEELTGEVVVLISGDTALDLDAFMKLAEGFIKKNTH